MARFTADNLTLAQEIIGRYPRPKSALIPLLHLAQEQDGYVTRDAMVHISELVGVTPAEVLGTCSFYEMFKLEPVGRYLVTVCTNIACVLMGADDLVHHAEQSLGVALGETTEDGLFTLEGAECQAACTEAPCLQVNYRHEYRVTNERFDELVAELRDGRRTDVPAHGTLATVRQHIPEQRRAGVVDPGDRQAPAWLAVTAEPEAGGGA
jgi:NADH-quinone oxidoreductase subunit E